LYLTAGERVADVAGRTGADGVVIDDQALSVQSTSARTRVHTLLVDTGLGLRTLAAHYTLGFADR